MNKIAFLGFDQYQGKFNIGSSRIRCDWVLKYWDEASRYVNGGKYDAIIFQKAYFIEYLKRYKGVKILDMCDPDWLEPKSRVVECMQFVDAITTSSANLAKAVTAFTNKPVWFIPDRIDLQEHTKVKEHSGRAKSVVWFGYSHNFPVLHQALKTIADLGLELIIISNQAYHPPPAFVEKVEITNYPWGVETVNSDIQKADMVINPKLMSGRFKFKSDNKTLKSWALGMPVAENDRDLKKYMDASERTIEANKRRLEIENEWSCEKSVEEYKKLIESICMHKKEPTNTAQ